MLTRIQLIAGALGNKNAAAAAAVLKQMDIGKMMSGGQYSASEDCLFLDVIVPGRALRGEAKLPVANW
jgi:carboxylesterase type B